MLYVTASYSFLGVKVAALWFLLVLVHLPRVTRTHRALYFKSFIFMYIIL